MCVFYKATVKQGNWDWVMKHAGKPQDPELVKQASKQVNEFCRVLEMEGVTVRRPELINWTETGMMRTPDFEEGGRDRLSLLSLGNVSSIMYTSVFPFGKMVGEAV